MIESRRAVGGAPIATDFSGKQASCSRTVQLMPWLAEATADQEGKKASSPLIQGCCTLHIHFDIFYSPLSQIKPQLLSSTVDK